MFGPTDRACPRCGAMLLPTDINVGADTALCHSCGAAFPFSSLVARVRVDVSAPPKGVSVSHSPDGVSVSATTRAPGAAFAVILFLLVFVGTTSRGFSRLPDLRGWVDMAGMMSLFPVLIVLLAVVPRAAMALFGRVTVTRRGDDGRIFIGLGLFGWTRQFHWSEVQSILEEVHPGGRYPNAARMNLSAGGVPGSMKFATQLSEERRRFVIGWMQSQLRGAGG